MIASGLISFPVDTWPEVAVVGFICLTIMVVAYSLARWGE